MKKFAEWQAMKGRWATARKLGLAAAAVAALSSVFAATAPVAAEVTNGVERVDQPIVWGFGDFGYYSGYQLYGSIVNPDPVLQGYVEVNVNLPFDVGPFDDLGCLGAGYWFNSDLTGRRNASYRRAFNENDPNVHWSKTFWFDEKRTWGLGYRTTFIWYWYPRTGGRDPIHRITFDWDHYVELVNPSGLIPYVCWMHEYRVTYANLLQLGVKRPWEIADGLTVTPFVELVWRDRRYGWCFSNNGMDENGNMQSAGFATLKLELDATYMFTRNFGVFAKVAYCQNIDQHLRESAALARHAPNGDGYGRYNEFAWGGVGICLKF